MRFIINKLSRIKFYYKRKCLLKYLLLRFIKGYKIEEKHENYLIVRNIFNKVIFKVINHPEYLVSIDPLNELLVDSYINIQKGIFIDLGAFVGKYALKIAKNKNVKVIAVEPNPQTFQLLIESAALNRIGDNFVPLNLAIYKVNNVLIDFETNYSMSKIVFDKKEENSIKVKTISIEDVFINFAVDYSLPYLIKIDVEGFEVEIIKDLLPFLRNIKDVKIVCEILPQNKDRIFIIETLQSSGFNFEQIDQSNYFFEKT